MVLAFNLALSKQQGQFARKETKKVSIYNMSLYEVARSVIQEWNREDDRKAIIDHEQSNNNTDVK